MRTSVARIDAELHAAAKLVGDVAGRSDGQQVSHWARLGRELEASGLVTPRQVAAVLAGARSYDELSVHEQAVVRAEWAVRMDEFRSELDFASEFAEAGRRYVEVDDDGRAVVVET